MAKGSGYKFVNLVTAQPYDSFIKNIQLTPIVENVHNKLTMLNFLR